MRKAACRLITRGRGYSDMLARLGDGRGVEDIVALFEWSVSLPSPDSQYKCFPRCFLV